MSCHHDLSARCAPDYQADCLVYNGNHCYEYTVYTEDGAGCRYSVHVNCYAWFSNYCTGQESWPHTGSYSSGPHYYQCPGQPYEPAPCPGCSTCPT